MGPWKQLMLFDALRLFAGMIGCAVSLGGLKAVKSLMWILSLPFCLIVRVFGPLIVDGESCRSLPFGGIQAEDESLCLENSRLLSREKDGLS